MDSDEMTSYLSSHVDFHDRTKSDKVEELVRMLNVQLGRTIYNTLPRSINGTGLPTLLGQELGLYSTPELSGLKNKMLTPLQALPGSAGKYFTPDVKTKKKEYFKNTKYTPAEVNELLDVFG